jgi:hypothetical protein
VLGVQLYLELFNLIGQRFDCLRVGLDLGFKSIGLRLRVRKVGLGLTNLRL